MKMKSKLFRWIRDNWEQIWGAGTYIEGEYGMYVVVPLDLLAEHFGCSTKDIIYGEEE